MTQAAVEAMAVKNLPGAKAVENLRRLSGGASQETWAFETVGDAGRERYILRRAPGGDRQHDQAVGMAGEAALMKLAVAKGVPAPIVHHVFTPEDNLGFGFIVNHIDGETLGRKIVVDPKYAKARETLAFDCGKALAQIHTIPLDKLPRMRTATARGRTDELYARYKVDIQPRPVIALAIQWLYDNLPPEPDPLQLVHGDFRNGNLIIGEDGLRAVLDWELAHIGDPIEDLGWLCTGAWRFGGIDHPVGGFGQIEDMLAGYRAGGGRDVPLEEVKFWTVFGSVSWGLSCSGMVQTFRGGIEKTSDRAMIARRASENEMDLVRLLVPKA